MRKLPQKKIKAFGYTLVRFLKRIHPAEIGISLLLVTVLIYYNIYYIPDLIDKWYYLYIFLVIFIAGFYGKIPAFLAIFLSLSGIICNLILIYDPDNVVSFFYTMIKSQEFAEFSLYLFAVFVLTVIIGEIRDSMASRIYSLKDESDILVQKISRMQQEMDALTLVNEEYQDRILGQQNSLISLYSTMISLNTLDLDSIFPSILDAIIKFTGAIRCSLWKYDRDDHSLHLLAASGWDEEEIAEKGVISDQDNINGWVARNNAIFSVKMLQKYKNLQELDSKDNIITLPLDIGNRVWGVANIEEMPFVKYNMYSERLLMMLADLATPVIENAIRYNELTKKGEVDPITGLHALDELFIVLKEEFQEAVTHNLNISFAVIELTNAEKIIERYTEKDVLSLVREISQLALQNSKGQAKLFQYKETFQFSILLSNMDHDGAAMFCLNLIEQHGQKVYKIGNEQVYPEIVIGYSSRRENHRSEEDLMFLAENLLEMQKI